MQQESLRAEQRVTSGSRASNRLRRDGRVPAVVYGTDVDPVPVHVSARDLYGVLHTEAGLNAIIEIEIGEDKLLTVAREVQRHPVRGDITHLDFINVRLDTEIEAEVGLEFIGTPFGVREDGGIVEAIETSVMISALPNAIPSSIEVDITDLKLHDTLKASDLPEIDGVTYTGDEGRPILTVILPAAEEEPVVELEEGEEVEGEPGEGADEASEDEASEDEG